MIKFIDAIWKACIVQYAEYFIFFQMANGMQFRNFIIPSNAYLV